MIIIVGGTYKEHCIDPHWSQLFGSGVRAAAALSEFHRERTLHTYVSDSQALNLTALSGTFGFQVRPMPIPDTIEFEYMHPLSDPFIRHISNNTLSCDKIRVKANNILRFGFIEGDGIVDGDYVTYDPQSLTNPQMFRSNGSSARHLAIVLNFKEAKKLTGETDIKKIGKALLKEKGTEAVVVKRGGLGATVFSRSKAIDVPSFRTETVWPIGSGDVFSAFFHYFWSVKRVSPEVAATKASMCAALYCESKVLPISKSSFRNSTLKPMKIRKSTRGKGRIKVYLAGPFFTLAQRWLITEVRRYLGHNSLHVLSPFHEVGPGVASAVVPKDIALLKQSDLVFAIADGLDSGTMFEIGYAKAENKPVVVLVQNESEENLKMLAGTDCDFANDLTTAIYKTVWKALELT